MTFEGWSETLTTVSVNLYDSINYYNNNNIKNIFNITKNNIKNIIILKLISYKYK